MSRLKRIVYQVNGKNVGDEWFEDVPDPEDAVECAKEHPAVSALIRGGYDEAVYVPDKLVNLITIKQPQPTKSKHHVT